MPDKARKSSSKSKVKDLPAKKPSKSEEGLTKGGVMSGRDVMSGIGGRGATLPIMTSDSSGNETVDGT